MDRNDSDTTRSVHCLTRWGRALAISLLAVVADCGGAGSDSLPTGPATQTPVLTVVSVSLPSDTIEVGATVTATAIGLDQNGRAIDMPFPAWSTTSAAIAMVDQLGVVTAIMPGQATLVASANGKRGQRLLTIVQPAISSILLTPDAARLVSGTTLQLSAVALDAGAHPLVGRRIDFASSDTTTARVTSTGIVTAFAPGVVTITATGDRARSSTALTVTATPDSVAAVSVNVGPGVMTVGGSLQLDATLKDAGGHILTGRTITWSVTGTAGQGVAVVSDAGLVTALAPGAIVVEAFSEGRHGAAAITVRDNTDSTIVVTFAGPNENETVGDTLLVIVGVHSLHPLTSVVADVGPYHKLLVLKFQRVGALGGAYLWVGALDITDLPTGPYLVKATATDATGARGASTRQFIRDTRTVKGGSSEQPKQK